MPLSRRSFLSDSARVTAGFLGLQTLANQPSVASGTSSSGDVGYGPLMPDPIGIFDLPKGFSYKVISKMGEKMADGLIVPGKPDGMATFPGPDGTTIVLCNHELAPDEKLGPFGEEDELLKPEKIDRKMLYDADEDKTPCIGGVSTIVYDTKKQKKVRQFLSLGGTIRNCAGGPTPWGTWVTCEECDDRAGNYTETKVTLGKDHGYNFEVTPSAEPKMSEPVALIDMGRFRHEAIAVDPKTNVIYQTEDRDDGLIYRFLPNTPEKLRNGGRLQALVIKDEPSRDTRNWLPSEGKEKTPRVKVGQKFKVTWMDMTDVTSPADDLRAQGFKRGAARFARGEGMWYGEGVIYFASTSGGETQKGQIWKYTPGENEGQASEEPGTLELFIESNKDGMVENADNLTIAPWGDLIVCEDRKGDEVRLIGVTTDGRQYPFANNQTQKELAGVCFSPDGSTLFVNIQHIGFTLAVTGPW